MGQKWEQTVGEVDIGWLGGGTGRISQPKLLGMFPTSALSCESAVDDTGLRDLFFILAVSVSERTLLRWTFSTSLWATRRSRSSRRKPSRASCVSFRFRFSLLEISKVHACSVIGKFKHWEEIIKLEAFQKEHLKISGGATNSSRPNMSNILARTIEALSLIRSFFFQQILVVSLACSWEPAS